MCFPTSPIREVSLCSVQKVGLGSSIGPVDEMADNTCHFGINSFFADNGLSDVESFLYFPADALQMTKIVQKVFFQRGIRFV